MQRVILEKKGLRRDVLERQRAPILKLRQEASTKRRKIREILSLQDQIFEETVAFLFPEHQQQQEQQLQELRRETLLLPPLLVATTDRRLTIDEFIKKEIALPKEVRREEGKPINLAEILPEDIISTGRRVASAVINIDIRFPQTRHGATTIDKAVIVPFTSSRRCSPTRRRRLYTIFWRCRPRLWPN